jgi:hypothetical protein
LLLPSSNTTLEADSNRMLPPEVTLHVVRLPLRTVEPSSSARVTGDVERESRELADADVDAIVLAATAPSSRNGIEYDQELMGPIEAAIDKPVLACFAMLAGHDVVRYREPAADMDQFVERLRPARGCRGDSRTGEVFQGADRTPSGAEADRAGRAAAFAAHAAASGDAGYRRSGRSGVDEAERVAGRAARFRGGGHL